MGIWPRMPAPEVSVSPDKLHPGPIRTVGYRFVLPGWTGNQWARMTVPSKEMTFQSLGIQGTGVPTAGRAGAGGWHVAAAVVASVVEVVADPWAEDEHPASTTALRTTTAATTDPDR